MNRNKKPRVGMITWHYYDNFGSALQAYALQQTIEAQGYSCEIINYRLPQYQNRRYLTSAKLFAASLQGVFNKLGIALPNYQFLRFRAKHLMESKVIYEEAALREQAQQYDMIVSGSDQIWAPSVYNPVYLLSFAPDDMPIFSYASSIGLNAIPDDLVAEYNHYLSRFHTISVREEQGAALLREKFGLAVTCVLDPTLLLEISDWQRISHRPARKKPYLLCYLLNAQHAYGAEIQKIAQALQLEIKCISANGQDQFFADTWISAIGPSEFISYVEGADYVLTDSFHGAIFSLLFHKQFFCFERFSPDDPCCQNSRIYNLLSRLDLENRIIPFHGVPQVSPEMQIDYAQVQRTLDLEKARSMRYLTQALASFEGQQRGAVQ